MRATALATLALAIALAQTATPAPARAQTLALRGGTAAPAPRSAAERVIDVLAHIRSTLRTSVYRHETRVSERDGRYEFDCSAMASWVLARSAPRALSAVGHGRVLAVDYYRAIARAPTERAARGWRQVARVADAQPGDVLAWQRPRWFPSRNTGHVAFITSTAEPFEGGYLLHIADSSSYQHQDDTRAGTGRTGFGEGVILVTADPVTGAGTGYGWFGRYSGEWIVPTPVAIGRPER